MLQVMTLRAPGNKAKITRRERQALLESLSPGEPELTFTVRGDPDPRLIQLARLLGQQLARQNFEAQMNKRGSNGS